MKGWLGWLIAAPVLCGAVALAYLPPRGISRESQVPLSGVMTGPPTAERRQANEIAKEWRRAALDARLHEWRQRLATDLTRRRSANHPTLVATIDTSWPRVVRERAARVIVQAWEALELGTTKIGIAVVIEPEQIAARAAAAGNAYLLPDSTDRHTCVAWTALRPAMRSSFEQDDERSAGWHAEWARTLLGPCAFYARFGRPSTEVERWLAQRQHRFAQLPAWDSTWTAILRRERSQRDTTIPESIRAAQRRAWLQRYPPIVLGCMAGRATACSAAALGRDPGYGTVPRLVVGTGRDDGEFPGAMLLLSDMAREFGSARFARFWTSNLAPDSAFHVAMDTTLGEWVLARQRALNQALVAGPLPAVGASAWALGIAALALGLAIAAATRRQIG